MKLTAFVAAVLLGTTAMAQTAAPAAEAPKPTWTFALKGFVSVSGAYQVGAFGLSEGQHSLYSATGAGVVHDKDSVTFDVRQSRFNFSVQGPKVLGGATPTGVLEIDFFQGFGAGANGDVSLLNRLRTVYSELNWGAHKIQAGQQNDLIFAMAPTSLSHIAQPLGYFTGNVGWRRPGFFGFHTLSLPSDLKLELAWEVGRSQWNDAAAPYTCTIGNGTITPTDPTKPVTCTTSAAIGGNASAGPGGINLGEASGGPALEGRVTVNYAKFVTVWGATHFQRIDLSGYGNTGTIPTGHPTIDTFVVNGGAKVTVPIPGDMALTLQGTGFSGKNLAPLVGLTQFKVGPNGESVESWGYWAQLGVNLTKELSLWGLYGQQKVNKTDYARAAFGGTSASAFENATTNVMAMYRDGGYGLSAEWIHFDSKYPTAGGTAAAAPITADRTSRADQYMVTANYFF